MRATIMYGAGDVRAENVPDPSILQPTDAILRVVRACICGSDLWPYNDMPRSEIGQSMGHEAIGVVEAVGREVRRVKRGQVVVMPFAISDGTCEFCGDGHGAHSVLECVGTGDATFASVQIARPGGAVGRVGVPHYDATPGAQLTFYKNVIVGGGPAPVRAYIKELLPDVLEGRIDPGRVFDRTVGLDGVPDGYRAMNQRESIKVLIDPA